MIKAKVTVHPLYVIDRVDPRIFGGFIEHVGRAIYEGIYEPDHPQADQQGFRQDTIELVRRLDMPVTRYPGGNFVSGYHWLDGVGPKSDRPTQLDLAWKTIETNQFGTNEFVDWCKQAGTKPMMAVNLGTAGPKEAQQLLEYCNHPAGSFWSDLRIEHGWKDPHDIKLWCLGNEMDGAWQICAKTATEYGRTAAEAAKMMKMTDASIELVVCGSSAQRMPTFASWESEVLEHTYPYVEYLSIHTYYANRDGDTLKFLSRSDQMNDFIKAVVATCDYVKAKKKTAKQINLSFDEWNVWYHSNEQDREIEEWTAPRAIIEDVYNMEDLLLVGSMLITLLNNADRVKIACIAQTVNVIAPIMTEKNGQAWAQTIFYPFEQASKYGRGTVLSQVIESASYDLVDRSNVPYLTSSTVLDEDGTVTLFAVNRHLDEDMELVLELHGMGLNQILSFTQVSHPDIKAINSAENPHNVVPLEATDAHIANSILKATLRPLSWNVIRLAA